MTAYSMETDQRRRLLHITLRGYWDQKTFDAFAVEYVHALRHMHLTGGLDKALVDGREFAVQSKDVSEQFRKLIADNKAYHAKRTATIVPAHLNKLQAERAGGELVANYFTDMDKAQAWLFETDARAA